MSASFAPTEATIEAAIDRRIGSAGTFQRVAEQIACGIYPDLAHTLVPSGRRPDDKTVQGWPDALLTMEDGRLIAIEATTAADARWNHWKKDLSSLEARLEAGTLGGLIWIAWCKSSTPTDEADMQEEVCRLGLAHKDVHIVFRKQLISLLSAPFHARFWVNELQLNVRPDPFNRISDVIRRTAQSSFSRIFPTPEEYENDRVHAPRLLAEVEGTLEKQRATIVVGHGASGKTTLAYLLAHRGRFKNAPTYILDLMATGADPTMVERASMALTACADHGVLFVIDNAHLDPVAAHSLIEQWTTYGRGSKLLVLMRRIHAKTEVWDTDPEIEEIGLPCFDLVIELADLEGVYRRHYLAQKGNSPLPVKADVLSQWINLFGGDLIAFSAAVLGLLERNGEPEQLGSEDARAWVHHHYLKAFAHEQSALLDLAAVAEIEGLVPVEAFDDDALVSSIGRGLVWVETHGRKVEHHLYRLAHSGLGTLLRDAAGCADTSREDRCRVLQDHTFQCTAVAIRLARSGDTDEAYALLEALWHRDNWPLSDVSLGYWSGPLRLTEELNVISVDEMSRRSSEWVAKLESRKTVVQSALMSTIAHLARILIVARQTTPEVAKVLREELSSDENSFLLIERALTSYLGGLLSFIEFAEIEMPEVGRVLHDGLKAERNRASLLKQALASPLGQLPRFLGYADSAMPEVANAIREGLKKDPDALVKQALATPLDHLVAFLGYAKAKMPEVAEDLCSTLLSDPLLPAMADRCMRDGPQGVFPICKYDSAFTRILSGIDADLWSQRWSRAHHGRPSWFRNFALTCYGAERGELVGPIAEAIIRNTRPGDISPPETTIVHLTLVLTSPQNCSAEEVDDFFARRLPPDYVASQYNSSEAKVGTLAGAVRSVALDERVWLGQHFCDPALWQRIHAEQPATKGSPRHVAAWLQLLSAARLLGLDAAHLQPVGSLTISEALKVWPPGPVDEGIQSTQAGLWTGLREWCHLNGEELTVDAVIAEDILAQFRAADPVGRPRIAALNAVMIDWLERCQARAWHLVADSVPLLDALENQQRLQETGGPGAGV